MTLSQRDEEFIGRGKTINRQRSDSSESCMWVVKRGRNTLLLLYVGHIFRNRCKLDDRQTRNDHNIAAGKRTASNVMILCEVKGALFLKNLRL